jgi:galactose mutarotase-like enzyme
MTAAEQYRIAASGIAATIKAQGAELCSLTDAAGREFLWQAGPIWPRHAPVLFPIVGRLAGDTLRHDGRSYRMTQHGFARDRRFEPAERSDTVCRFILMDDDATRAIFPFAFRLELTYAVAGDTLTVGYALDNPAGTMLHASFGAHPAFRWPLRKGTAKAAHVLEFSLPEPAPIRRLADGLLLPDRFDSPIEGSTLRLDESLFATDALILDQVASPSVRFSALGGPTVEVMWRGGFRELGLWSRAGGDFLCIEPWCGHADPVGFAGDFAEKPGLLHLPPGGRAEAELTVRLIG